MICLYTGTFINNNYLYVFHSMNFRSFSIYLIVLADYVYIAFFLQVFRKCGNRQDKEDAVFVRFDWQYYFMFFSLIFRQRMKIWRSCQDTITGRSKSFFVCSNLLAVSTFSALFPLIFCHLMDNLAILTRHYNRKLKKFLCLFKFLSSVYVY